MQDREYHLTYHYHLQKRITKLKKAIKIAKRHQHDFGHILLAKPIECSVSGIRIERDSTATPPLQRRNSSPGPTLRRRAKTIWIDEHESGAEYSVEEIYLLYYRHTKGWKGYCAEGGIARILFGFLFYDMLFTYIPNVFQTAYQTYPLGLYSNAFYPTRFSEI